MDEATYALQQQEERERAEEERAEAAAAEMRGNEPRRVEARAHLEAGRVKLSAGEWDDAITEFNAGLALRPNLSNYHRDFNPINIVWRETEEDLKKAKANKAGKEMGPLKVFGGLNWMGELPSLDDTPRPAAAAARRVASPAYRSASVGQLPRPRSLSQACEASLPSNSLMGYETRPLTPPPHAERRSRPALSCQRAPGASTGRA